jgi:hypothetical protein
MFDPVTKKGGWGFVIRDFAGDVIHAGAGVVLYAMDALHTEVLGCLAALKVRDGLTRDCTCCLAHFLTEIGSIRSSVQQ